MREKATNGVRMTTSKCTNFPHCLGRGESCNPECELAAMETRADLAAQALRELGELFARVEEQQDA